MSLVRTLAKVAIGVAVAKGVKDMTSNRNDGVSRGPRAGELGGLGGLLGGGGAPAGSPLGGMLSQIAGGGMGAAPGAPSPGTGHRIGGGAGAGGQGGAAMGAGMRPGADTSGLDPLGAGAGTATGHGHAASGGGMDDILRRIGGAGGAGGIAAMLGQALSGGGRGGASSGGLGDLLSGLGGGRGMGAGAAGGGFGTLLNQSLRGGGTEPEAEPTRAQEEAAGVLLAAMIQAAKADGHVDAEEQARILGQVGDVTPDEEAFVRAEMERPVDARALAARVPEGMGAQVYLMSLLAIDVDTPEEARYLRELREALGLGEAEADDIERQLRS